jgi:hypothetical protein
MRGIKVWACLALLLGAGQGFAQEDPVLRTPTPERLEKFLQNEMLEIKKGTVPKEDVHFFTFKRGKFEVRLTSFGAKDLMLDCTFKPLPLDKINRWNISAKFSRASLQQDAKGEPYSILEYNLDLSGGVTVEALRHYLARFDQELKNYDIYVSGAPDEKILNLLTDERLEKILKALNIAFQKKTTNGGTTYEFELDGHKLRLQSYGGKDLRLAAKFAPLPLEVVNEYNLNRKFIRAVNYKKDDMELTALESNLDCEPGITEGMVRHFVMSFAEDVRHFTDFIHKRQSK